MILSLTMNLFTEEIWMTDKKMSGIELNPENFKEYVLEIERENLKNIDKDEKKIMVAKIIRTYEEAKKNGNS